MCASFFLVSDCLSPFWGSSLRGVSLEGRFFALKSNTGDKEMIRRAFCALSEI